MMNELSHHGILGQKWGVRNGPPYPLSEDRKTKSEKNTFRRYSSVKETNLRNGTYVSNTSHDKKLYEEDAILGKLGFKDADKIFEMRIEAIEPINVATGKQAMEYMVEDIKASLWYRKSAEKQLKKDFPHFEIGEEEETLLDTYNKLESAGFYDTLDPNKRWDIAMKALGGNEKEVVERRNDLARRVHDIAVRSDGLFEYFRDKGFDAVVDPEDYTYNYENPMIILNPDKFRIRGVRALKDEMIDKVRKDNESKKLSHSFKGTEWKRHKYIRKENGRYIYPKDISSQEDYDNALEMTKEKIDSLEATKSRHEERANKARESGDFRAAEEYEKYIANIDSEVAKLKEELQYLVDIKYVRDTSPGDAQKLKHIESGEDFLEHHGILGQKWGVQNGPPYPLSSDQKSADEKKKKKSSGILSIFKKKSKSEPEEKEETPEEHEARRQAAINKGTAKEVMEFQGELSNNELNTAIQRIQFEKRLKDLIAEDEPSIKNGMEKAQEFMDNVGKVRNMAEIGINAYNTTVKIAKAFDPNNKMPVIGEKQKTSEEKAREAAVKSGDRKLLKKYMGQLDAKEVGDAAKIIDKWDEILGKDENSNSTGSQKTFSFENMSKKEKKQLRKLLDDYMDERNDK